MNREVVPHPFIRSIGLVALGLAAFVVLRPFLTSLVWAFIVSVLAWPFNRYLRHKMRNHHPGAAAGIMTLLLVALILGIVLPISFQIVLETKQLILALRAWASTENPTLPASLERLPWIRKYLEAAIDQGATPKEIVSPWLNEYQSQIVSAVSFAARGIWNFCLDLVIMIFSTYFFFRHGDAFAHQLLTAAERIGGDYYLGLARTSWTTIHGVGFGVGGAAVSQGVLAGLGYYACDVPLPFLFAILTTILGLAPMGPPLVYLALAIFLYMNGAPWYVALSLVMWGIVIVSTVDNLVRTLFISHATHLPILLAFFGGLGGIAAFGMVGLFVGPVVLALAHNVWMTVCGEGSTATSLKRGSSI